MSAKEFQDKFALEVQKKNQNPYPYFLDIGCGDCHEGNNSIELEKLGWKGLLIDQNPTNFNGRRNEVIKTDCKSTDWRKIFKEQSTPLVIDYISLDVDEANIEVIQNFPTAYEFVSMTFETDKYNCGDFRKKHLLKFIDKNPQYLILFENVKIENLEFEDWIVNKKFTRFNKQLGNALDYKKCLEILKNA